MPGKKKSGTLLRGWKGKARVDVSRVPKWWLTQPEETERFLRSLRGVKVWEIGRSAGGRPIIAAAWGPREDLPGRTALSLASAISGGKPEAFYGVGKRKRPGFLFLGNAHGIEFEGTVAALNFLNVVVTGRDLRGRAWPELQKAGRRLRIVIIPHFNIDGRERYARVKHFINVHPDESRRISQGDWKSGEKLVWPTSKLHWPLPVDKIAPLGGYFNDAGVNLVYDNGLTADFQPETRALLEFLREERPDAALLSHTDNGSLVCEPSSYIPAAFRQRQLQISALAGARCKREGMSKFRMAKNVEGYAGQVFYQADLVYHACGALPLLVEFPCGYQNLPDNFNDILDIGMYVIEEIVRFGVDYGFRP